MGLYYVYHHTFNDNKHYVTIDNVFDEFNGTLEDMQQSISYQKDSGH